MSNRLHTVVSIAAGIVADIVVDTAEDTAEDTVENTDLGIVDIVAAVAAGFDQQLHSE